VLSPNFTEVHTEAPGEEVTGVLSDRVNAPAWPLTS
jgi:hypothetical protein